MDSRLHSSLGGHVPSFVDDWLRQALAAADPESFRHRVLAEIERATESETLAEDLLARRLEAFVSELIGTTGSEDETG